MLSSLLGLVVAGSGAQSNPKPDLSKDSTLYIVGYAHLDTQWRWPFTTTIGEFLPNTMHENFKLFKEFPGYTFNFTGSNRYRLMKEYWPEDYAQLKRYVKQGRWVPVGSSVEEGDVNSPSLESLVRQVLYANEFFDKEFGQHSNEYMVPDCFGFPAALPSVLAHCGVKGFSTQKLTWGSAVGIPFNLGVWEGPDGKSVVAALNPGSYGSEIKSDLTTDPTWLKRIQDNGATTGIFADYHYFGTGDFGGSPKADSVAMAEKSLAGTGPLKVIGGRADQIFNDLTSDQVSKLPRYKGDLELTQHSAGSLTSQSQHKKWNHENEKLAQAAEEASVAAGIVSQAVYPTDKLQNAWTLFLAGQFHDTMAGTAIPKAYEYAWNDDCIALNEFASVLDAGVTGASQALNTGGAGIPLVVFNPTSINRNDLVEANVGLLGRSPYVQVTTPSGEVEPAQVVGRVGRLSKIVFQAHAPSVSFGVYHVTETDVPVLTYAIAKGNVLENSHLRVTIGASGDVVSVFDKQGGRETLAGPIRLALVHENPREYPAWNMDWSDQKKPPYAYVDGPASINVVEEGPLRGSIRVERKAQGSTFVQEIRLSRDSDRLEFADSINWKTKETALKQEFKLAASNPQATYNWQVGTVQRGNNDPKKYEVGSHRWFDLTDQSGDFGASILTGFKVGSDKPDDQTLRLTLLYTPGVQGGYQDQATQDWGHHDFVYGFLPHASDWKTAGTAREATELDQPMLAFRVAPHIGTAGNQISLASVDNPHLSIVAFKQSEDGTGVIVRVRENDGLARAGVSLAMLSDIQSAESVDGQEHKLGDLPVAGGRLTFDIGAYGVAAFKLRLANYDHRVDRPTSLPLSLPYNLDVISMPDYPADGNFDGQRQSLAGDQMPETLTNDGVIFKFGPKSNGAKNAVACQGQTITLPAGDWKSVHILAASSDGPRRVGFGLGSDRFDLTIADWSGYIGQWDTRHWGGLVPPMAYGWNNPLTGVEQGFLRRDHIAWNSSHRHDIVGNQIYQYSYLFAYDLPVLAGRKTLTLPNDPAVKILAVSVSSESSTSASEASTLIDGFQAQMSEPEITPRAGTFNDATLVTIEPGLYGNYDALKYSINGLATSYTGPFYVHRNSRIVASVGNGPEVSANLIVDDTTMPRVVSGTLWPDLDYAEITFSEPVMASQDSFLFEGAKVAKVQPSQDGKTLHLDLVGRATGASLEVRSVRDYSPHRNEFVGTVPVAVGTASLVVDQFTADGKTLVKSEPKLPTDPSAPWTINFFVRLDQMPDDLTPVAGFGQSEDRINGASRYICKFGDGIHFWGCNVDIATNTPFDVHAWQMITASFDGDKVTLYKNAKRIAQEHVALAPCPPVAKIAGLDGWDHKRRFLGEVQAFKVWPVALDEEMVQNMFLAKRL